VRDDRSSHRKIERLVSDSASRQSRSCQVDACEVSEREAAANIGLEQTSAFPAAILKVLREVLHRPLVALANEPERGFLGVDTDGNSTRLTIVVEGECVDGKGLGSQLRQRRSHHAP